MLKVERPKHQKTATGRLPFFVDETEGLAYIAAVDFLPVDELPEVMQMRCTAVAVINIIGVLPHIHRQQRFQSLGERVAGIGLLGDDQLTVLVLRQLHPAGTEERHALLLELRQ